MVSMIFFSPHPDDEVLAGGALIAATPDTLIIPVTAGGASGARARTDLSQTSFEIARLVEQAQAACALGATRIAAVPSALYKDGHVTTSGALALMRIWHGRHPGAVLATTSVLDDHPDHKACAMALDVLENEGITARYVASYAGTGRGQGVEYTDTTGRVVAAVRAYTEGFAIGHLSVPEQFDQLLADPSDWVLDR